MSDHYQIRLSGFGGQGLVLAGIILGEAVAIYQGLYAVQSQSYGPEARGGASRSEIVISNEEGDYLEVTAPDLLLALSQEACDKYVVDIKEDALVIVDPEFVKKPPQVKKLYQVPITQVAREEVGKTIVANMVALGSVVALTNLITLESLKKAVKNRVPKGTIEMNVKAVDAGFSVAKKLLQ